MKTYTELSKLTTFKERFEYLQMNGNVGAETFGFDRYFNQRFYRSREWKSIRDAVIVRDNGCDLGIEGMDVHRGIIVHHMNLITLEDINMQPDFLLNPEFLITTTRNTHNAIHYGDESLLITEPTTRQANDTKLW